MTALTTAADTAYAGGGLIIWLVVGLIFAFICGSIAGRKGYSAILFGILGFFFACITLIVVLVIPRRGV